MLCPEDSRDMQLSSRLLTSIRYIPTDLAASLSNSLVLADRHAGDRLGATVVGA